MKNSFATQLWIVFKIWFFSVQTNTLLGTFYLSDFFTRMHFVGDLVVMGTGYATVFSFPGMVILLVIINRCIAANTKGLLLFRIVFISGIALSIIVFLAFWVMTKWFNKTEMGTLLCVAILAAITGMITQYKSILKAGSEFQHTTAIDQ